LNSGLLNIEKVLEQIIAYSEEIGVKLNSFEGFVRQIIGWREFVRALYILEGENQFKSNFWGFESKLPRQFYDGSTGIEPVDFTIKNVLKNAYAHHIERLMILGNFMLLCEIHPKEVYKWFMELFIDAYDWVMVPNIFGMSQYADGGLMTTKPYISSSNYIRKMSDFKTGPWCDVWDGLFWRFVYKHKKVFAGNPRMKIMAIRADRMPKDKMNEYIKKSETYLKRIY
jgi:deoxyribodipyrimidine photolyase-related protein